MDRPAWYFLFLFQFLKVFEGWGATGEFFGAIVVPGVVMGIMFLMPIIGRWRLGHGFNIAFTLGLLAGVGLLTALATNEDYAALWSDRKAFADVEQLLEETGNDREKLAAHFGGDAVRLAAFDARVRKLERIRHSQSFLDAVRDAKADAARAVELAGRPERIPPTGALDLVRNDAFTQGPRLFAQHCAGCHAHVDPASPGAAAVLAKSSAANLHGFGGLAWARGLLDPARVGGPAYFGNTAHKDGSMVSFVKDELSDSSAWSPADVEAVATALAAEAGLAPAGIDAAVVERGRGLIADGERCGSCHRYGRTDTEPEDAPNLTGWGTRDWLVGIIADPTHERFYGADNDRMPSFGGTADGAPAVLSRRQIELVADWLRGEWYRGGH